MIFNLSKETIVRRPPEISKLNSSQSRLLKLGFGLVSVFVLAITLSVNAFAQGSAVTRVSSSAAAAEDTVYRIGPDDVLTILVRKAPELSSEAVRVDSRGMIRIPMVDELVPAACQTENELAARIT